jgi:hypothetical protein
MPVQRLHPYQRPTHSVTVRGVQSRKTVPGSQVAVVWNGRIHAPRKGGGGSSEEEKKFFAEAAKKDILSIRKGDCLFGVKNSNSKMSPPVVTNNLNGTPKTTEHYFVGTAIADCNPETNLVAILKQGTQPEFFNNSDVAYRPGDYLIWDAKGNHRNSSGMPLTVECDRSPSLARPTIWAYTSKPLLIVLNQLRQVVKKEVQTLTNKLGQDNKFWTSEEDAQLELKNCMIVLRAHYLESFGGLGDLHPLVPIPAVLLAHGISLVALSIASQPHNKLTMKILTTFLENTAETSERWNSKPQNLINMNETLTSFYGTLISSFKDWETQHVFGQSLDHIPQGHTGTILVI